MKTFEDYTLEIIDQLGDTADVSAIHQKLKQAIECDLTIGQVCACIYKLEIEGLIISPDGYRFRLNK